MKRTITLLFLVVSSFQLLIASGHIYSYDGEVVFRTAVSIVERGQTSVDLTEENQGYVARGTDGRYYSMFGLGFSLVLVPVYIVIREVSELITDDLSSREYLIYFFLSFTNAFILSLLTVAAYLLYRLFTGEHYAALGAFLLVFSTFLYPYGRTLFNDPVAALLMTCAVLFSLRAGKNGTPIDILLAGVFAAALMLTRIEYILSIPGLIILVLADSGKIRISRHTLKRIGVFLLPVLFIRVCLIFYNYTRFGSLLDTQVYENDSADRFSTPLWEGLAGLFLSPGKSLFIYAPTILLSFLSIPRWFRKDRMRVLAFLAIVIPPTLVHAKWHSWMGGLSWGPRRLVVLLPVLFIPLVYSLHFWTGGFRRGLLILLGIVGFLIQIPGLLVNFMHYYNPEYNPAAAPFRDILFTFTKAPYVGHLVAWWKGYLPLDLFWFRALHTQGVPLAVTIVLLSSLTCLFSLWKLSRLCSLRTGKE